MNSFQQNNFILDHESNKIYPRGKVVWIFKIKDAEFDGMEIYFVK
jgi:hypothetical protein